MVGTYSIHKQGKNIMTNYILIQKNYAIMGLGKTKKEALEEVCEWTDYNNTEEILYKESYNTANEGDFCLLECTKDLYDYVCKGGQFYEVNNNIATIEQ
jgi:hypothetical protein